MAFDVGGGGKKKGRATPDMNVTPLVDVVLVLLIIFMVVTPMLAKQFWVHVPPEVDENDPPPPPDPDAPPSVVVTVLADGTVRVNRDVVTLADLPTRVTRALAARGDRTVFFDAASDAPYGVAVDVLDTLRSGGATTIAVMTEPLADGAI